MQTYRPISLGAEEALFETITTKGIELRLIDYMGNDDLLEYVTGAPALSYMSLKEHHAPFKFAKLKFHVRAPIEDALSCTLYPNASINEYSGRYSEMIDAADTTEIMYDRARRERYNNLLKKNVSREQARLILGTDNLTEFVWKVSLIDLYRSEGLIPGLMKGVAMKAFPLSYAALEEPDRYHAQQSVRDEIIVSKPISRLRNVHGTKRQTNMELEHLLNLESNTQYGSIALIDYMGVPDDIANAARTSYGEGTSKRRNNNGLTRALFRDMHTSPFEMVDLSWSEKAPFFIEPRQLGRHRTLTTQSHLNFFPKGNIAYIPKIIREQDSLNKQGGSEKCLDLQNDFQQALNAERDQIKLMRSRGFSEEAVRRIKGVWRQTRVHRTGDLHNILHMVKLRMDPHAQYEAQLVATDIANFVAKSSPAAWKAFQDYQLNSVRFSAQEIEMLRGQVSEPEGKHKSVREQAAFRKKLDKFT